MDQKKCKICKELKDLTEYHKEARYLDGYLNKCKVCRKKNLNIQVKEEKKEYIINYYYDVTKPKRDIKKAQEKQKREKRLEYQKNYYHEIVKPNSTTEEARARRQRKKFLEEPLEIKGRTYQELTPEEKFKVALLLLAKKQKKAI